MTKATQNAVASVLARLKNIAQRDGRSFNDVLQAYVNERFLARIAATSSKPATKATGSKTEISPQHLVNIGRRSLVNFASLLTLLSSSNVEPRLQRATIRSVAKR